MTTPVRVPAFTPAYTPTVQRPIVRRRPTLDALTALRFVAALWVLLFHVVGHPPTNPVYRLISRGYVGVSLFFVLSGFILTYRYLDVDAQQLRGTVRAFVWARVARIYPVYLLALVIALPSYLWSVPASDRLALVLTPALVQAWVPHVACQWNCPGWSLSAEAFFYALFPVVGVWLTRRRHALPLALGLWTLMRVVPIAYGLADPTPVVDVLFNPLVHVADFVLGVATGIVFVRRTSPRWVPRAAGIMGAVVLGALVFVPGIPTTALRTGLLAPAFALLIVALARVPLRARWAVRLGEASYALYLVHIPIHEYVMHAAPSVLRLADRTVDSPHVWSALIATQVVLSVALSLAIFAWIEDPARRAIGAMTAPYVRPKIVTVTLDDAETEIGSRSAATKRSPGVTE